MPYDIIHFYKHKASKEFAFITNAVNESAHDFNNRSKIHISKVLTVMLVGLQFPAKNI